jgi:hypothetical protein
MDWAKFWATFSQTHLVTLVTILARHPCPTLAAETLDVNFFSQVAFFRICLPAQTAVKFSRRFSEERDY